jgi:hypothetical protein
MSLPEVVPDQLAGRLLLIRAHLDERAWRLLLGAEAKVLGRGGIKTVAAAAGVSFASVCVALLTAREFATPGRTCMLYTDLANPTSNSIYQQVGYRRVGDAVELRFETPTPGQGLTVGNSEATLP